MLQILFCDIERNRTNELKYALKNDVCMFRQQSFLSFESCRDRVRHAVNIILYSYQDIILKYQWGQVQLFPVVCGVCVRSSLLSTIEQLAPL